MVNKLFLLISFLICFFSLCGNEGILLAQSGNSTCGTDFFYQKNTSQNPTILENSQSLEAFTKEWIKKNRNNANQREILEIPVVVHIVWNKTEENISEAQVFSQIEVLNEDFQQNNSDLDEIPSEFAPMIANIEFQFCLANTDPEGNPSNGINRRFTSFEQVAFQFGAEEKRRVKHENLGGADAWNPNKYLNIWVSASDGIFIGDATFPGQVPLEEDGIVIDHRYFGTTGTVLDNPSHALGRTATHEVGHYFNLQHLWGSVGSTCTEDDGVDDTPFQESFYLDCPSHPQVSCGSKDQFMNFMNFVSDDCMHLFTEGQKWRMWATLHGPRSGLLNSDACGNNSFNISPFSENSYTIYPNPASNVLNVWLENREELEHIVLYSLDGKVVKRKTTLNLGKLHQFDLNQIPAGIYVLQIQQINKDFYQKIMIRK